MPVWLTWQLFFKKILPVLMVGLFLYWVYSKGVDSGKAEVQASWDARELEVKEREKLLQQEIAQSEKEQRDISRKVADEIANANAEHASDIAAVRLEYTQRLRNSESRAQVYQHMSAAGAAERSDLASHAAELDRALEQGRELVGELRATVGQRDRVIQSLGEQLLADRELMNSAVSPEAESTQD